MWQQNRLHSKCPNCMFLNFDKLCSLSSPKGVLFRESSLIAVSAAERSEASFTVERAKARRRADPWPWPVRINGKRFFLETKMLDSFFFCIPCHSCLYHFSFRGSIVEKCYLHAILNWFDVIGYREHVCIHCSMINADFRIGSALFQYSYLQQNISRRKGFKSEGFIFFTAKSHQSAERFKLHCSKLFECMKTSESDVG